MEATLTERGSRYGSWRTQAEIAQAIKDAYRSSVNWDKLPAYMRETFDINANKAARCLNGDFMYLDNWHDMTNYLKLAEDCLEQDLAAGVGGHTTIDPDNPPLEWLIEKLAEKGFEVAIPPAEDRTEEVAEPAFLNDPVRAAGARFTRDPPPPNEGSPDL